MGIEKLRDTPTFGRLFREIEEEATKRGMQEAERNFATKLLRKGYSEEEISELTGLEMKDVTELRKSFES